MVAIHRQNHGIFNYERPTQKKVDDTTCKLFKIFLPIIKVVNVCNYMTKKKLNSQDKKAKNVYSNEVLKSEKVFLRVARECTQFNFISS